MDVQGTMFFEIDDILAMPAPSCRFLVGREMRSPERLEYIVRVYREDSLSCEVTETASPAQAVRRFNLQVSPMRKSAEA
eukprot:1054772-Prymnesium_polylepis.1